MKNYLKKFSYFLLPATGLGYYYQNHYNTKPSRNTKVTLNEEDLSGFFKEYVTKHKLIVPPHYKEYVSKLNKEAFFDKSILQELGGLTEFSILLEKNYHDKLHSDLTPEEKKIENAKAKIYCLFVPTEKVQGHHGIVHGGFTATLFDNVSGALAFYVHGMNPSATAYLNVTYKKPLKVDQEYVMVTEVKKIEGNKAFIEGTIRDKHDNVYAKAESMFVRVNWGTYFVPKAVKEMFKSKEESAPVIEKVSPISNLQLDTQANVQFTEGLQPGLPIQNSVKDGSDTQLQLAKAV